MSYFGVVYEIRGRYKKTGKSLLVLSQTPAICFASLARPVDNQKERSFDYEKITYWPTFHRQFITSSHFLSAWIDFINRLYPSTREWLDINSYFRGLSLDLTKYSYHYILAMFSLIRMLDEDPKTVLQYYYLQAQGLPFAGDFFKTFLFCACHTARGYDSVKVKRDDDFFGHYFPGAIVYKNALSSMRGSESKLLEKPVYNKVPHRDGDEINKILFGPAVGVPFRAQEGKTSEEMRRFNEYFGDE
jgi:hypothetical protein